MWRYLEELQLPCESKMRRVTESDNVSTKCFSKTSYFNRTCLQNDDRNTFRVVELTPTGTRYMCMMFLKRSDNVIQVMQGPIWNRNVAELCDESKMFLEEWPWIASWNEMPTACPISGGFMFRTISRLTNQDLCEGDWRMSRLEVECFNGDGMTFISPINSKCNPFSSEEDTVQLYCWAGWHHGRFTYMIGSTNGKEPQFCIRFPRSTDGIFQVFIYFSVICPQDENGNPPSGINYYELKVQRRDSTKCEDEEPSECAKLKAEGMCESPKKEFVKHCPKSCGQCGKSYREEHSYEDMCEFRDDMWPLLDKYRSSAPKNLIYTGPLWNLYCGFQGTINFNGIFRGQNCSGTISDTNQQTCKTEGIMTIKGDNCKTLRKPMIVTPICIFPKYTQSPREDGVLLPWKTKTVWLNIRNDGKWREQSKIFVDGSNMWRYLEELQLPCESKMRRVTESDNVSTKCFSKTSYFNRTCLQNDDRNTFRVVELTPTGTRYMCMMFLKRSDNVIQVMQGPIWNRNVAELCDESKMFLEEWPWIASWNEMPTACPISGGFMFRTISRLTNQDLCEGDWRMSRLEVECFNGDGMTFISPINSKCNPFSSEEDTVQLYCWAGWHHGRFTYMIGSTNGKEPQFCIRFPRSTDGIFQVFIYFSVICPQDENGNPPSGINYYELKVQRRDSTKCEDEEPSECAKLKAEGMCESPKKEFVKHCPKSCGQCGKSYREEHSYEDMCEFRDDMWPLLDKYRSSAPKNLIYTGPLWNLYCGFQGTINFNGIFRGQNCSGTISDTNQQTCKTEGIMTIKGDNCKTLRKPMKLYDKLYDKRDDFNFSITNFPFLSSNIPSSPAYGVFISQLIRYARASTKYTDFVLRARRLSDKLLSQGYACDRLTSSLRKFYGRYGELVIHYDVPLSRMMGDILS
ncbi:hypothetical protein FSP39_014237 [Pinctada imbricata]|uniref:ShKT domain-containing protein n=1 Tax=Pinctada imbricata TaxID=66713 RepID=A0AA89C3T4_PINIB|nr:hypothetical protein FSP39_014237 [Pinctada imbricata]